MRLALDQRTTWLGCPVSPSGYPEGGANGCSTTAITTSSSQGAHQRHRIKIGRKTQHHMHTSSCSSRPQRLVTAVLSETLEPSVAEGKPERLGSQGSKRVVLVRHGQSTWNESGRIQGSSDTSILTSRGEIQAETSRQMLSADSFDLCFYSPLSRAKRTAEIIWDSRKREDMVPLWDLREIDLYSFQGLFKGEGKERYGEQYRMWQNDPVNFNIDEHYPVRELWDRAQSCWNSILSSNASSVLVVAHNAVNQALVATATGLGSQYFRQLLQSNCGVSVLDFTPRQVGDGPPLVCLDRLNQTPGPPLMRGGAGGAGRKSQVKILLVCHGATDSNFKKVFPVSENEPMNMLGIIQSGKTAELLLDVNVDSLVSSPNACARNTAGAVAQVQEAAECLGGDCIPKYLDVTEIAELRDLDWGAWKGMPKEEVSTDRWQDYFHDNQIPDGETMDEFWERAGRAWQLLLDHVEGLETETGEKTTVVVGHEAVHAAMLCHCLGLRQSYFSSFRLDTSSFSVVEFPDGPAGKGIVRCLNYTAHLGRWAVPVTRPSLEEDTF